MPRVNRDLQRRMAARRERERRRPTGERRYRFATPEPALEPEEGVLDTEAELSEESLDQAPARSRFGRTSAAAATVPPARGDVRTAHRPFSAYKDEYAYVYGDLRRVGLVIGSLLLALIVLYFALPALVR